MAITNVRQQVLQDVRDKIDLERKLVKKLRTLDAEVISLFKDDAMNGQMTRADIFEPEFEELLFKHYDAVSDTFGGRISDELPKNEGLTDAEKATLAAAILLFIKRRSVEQARIILQTTQKDMATSVKIAVQETEDPIERALVASAVMSRQLTRRRPGIAALETQAMAEAAKVIEFDVLAKKRPLSLEKPARPLNKEWVTVGDHRVRPAHARADGQVRGVDELFIVKREQLRFPGDTSFGATPGNVINCRCSAVYDIAELSKLR